MADSIKYTPTSVDFSSAAGFMRNALEGFSNAGTVFGQIRNNLMNEEQQEWDRRFKQSELDERIRQYNETQDWNRERAAVADAQAELDRNERIRQFNENNTIAKEQLKLSQDANKRAQDKDKREQEEIEAGNLSLNYLTNQSHLNNVIAKYENNIKDKQLELEALRARKAPDADIKAAEERLKGAEEDRDNFVKENDNALSLKEAYLKAIQLASKGGKVKVPLNSLVLNDITLSDKRAEDARQLNQNNFNNLKSYVVDFDKNHKDLLDGVEDAKSKDLIRSTAANLITLYKQQGITPEHIQGAILAGKEAGRRKDINPASWHWLGGSDIDATAFAEEVANYLENLGYSVNRADSSTQSLIDAYNSTHGSNSPNNTAANTSGNDQLTADKAAIQAERAAALEKLVNSGAVDPMVLNFYN